MEPAKFRNTAPRQCVSAAGLQAMQRSSLMRRFLLNASALAAILTVPTLASAQVYAADIYPAPGAVVVNPPGAIVVNPPAVVAAPMVESQVYLAPGQTYDDQAIIINGQRYYRDCWWDWGRRRCDLKPWW
jgi:hypothetical protein